MAERSMRKLLRSRVMPIAFIGALALLATRTCNTGMATVELQFDLGAAASDVDKLEVTVHRGDDVENVAFFELDYRSGLPARKTLQLDSGSYRLKFLVWTRTGTRRFERRIEAIDGATVVVNLERDLIPAAAVE